MKDPSFDDVMARLQAGDEAAAATVFRRYAGRLIGLARGRLGALGRSKSDPESVLQSVFCSFFLRHADGAFELGGWDSLWSLLTVLAVRKCNKRVDYYRAARRDVRREADAGAAPDSFVGWETFANEPTPDEAVALAELVERLLTGLSDDERQMLVMVLQGHTQAEVAEQVGRTERTVQRLVQRVRKRLERWQTETTPTR